MIHISASDEQASLRDAKLRRFRFECTAQAATAKVLRHCDEALTRANRSQPRGVLHNRTRAVQVQLHER